MANILVSNLIISAMANILVSLFTFLNNSKNVRLHSKHFIVMTIWDQEGVVLPGASYMTFRHARADFGSILAGRRDSHTCKWTTEKKVPEILIKSNNVIALKLQT